MTEYIYIVKCPGCEDEMFNFFTDARMQCDLLMSKKPTITQVEVERNDFGECTDSHDLGTVWSWEDVMKDTCTDDEPAKCVFTRDDLKDYVPDEDPEFDTLDNSVDCCTPRLTEAAATEFIDLGDGHKISKEALYDELAVNGNDITIPLGDLGISNADIHFYDHGYYAGSELNIYKDGNEFSITVWHSSDDGDLVEGDSFESKSFEEFWQKLITYVDVELEESCERKPIPEGMTIEQLVEEMEENEDTVECTWCEELFDKSECRKEVDLGWLCSRCEMAIKSRGETLTFREGNYWDFLDEDLEELSFSEMVADSINHLINDLGKDSSAEDFVDDVIKDIENNYDTETPEDPEKYRDWASVVAGEVSRQLNNSDNLTEASLSDIAAAANSEFGSSWNSNDILDIAGVEERPTKQIAKPVTPKAPKPMWVLVKPNPPIEVPPELVDCVSASDSVWARSIFGARHGNLYDKGLRILPFEDACKVLSKEDCERARHMDESLAEDIEELHDLGNEYDGGYPAETPEVSDSHLKLCPECGKESFDIETGICVDCGFN